MSFEVEVGHCSLKGPREVNEDFAASLRPAPHDEARGLVAAIADGVSAGGRGLEAAQTTVMSVVQDYFCCPDTWDTTVVLDRLIGAQNAWLADHNQRRLGAGEKGGRRDDDAHCARAARPRLHAGARGRHARLAAARRTAECVQLTPGPLLSTSRDQRSRLTRAVGLDDRVRIDFLQGELHIGDVFVLTSDGVHGVLKRARLAALAREGDAQAASEALVRAALAAGSRDNATALVHARARARRRADSRTALLQGRQLPVPPRLKVGDRSTATRSPRRWPTPACTGSTRRATAHAGSWSR